jgi:hypothetical protein
MFSPGINKCPMSGVYQKASRARQPTLVPVRGFGHAKTVFTAKGAKNAKECFKNLKILLSFIKLDFCTM